VRLVFVNRARKFVGLVALLFFALPFGLSVTGCGHKAAPIVYCNPGDTGPIVGQVATITLSPTLATTGESLNYGQIGQGLSASATDCKGNPVTVKSYTYGSTSSFGVNTVGGPIIADINPSNGQVCGGTWNRNSSGGVPNYTTCTPPPTTPTAYMALVTAEAEGQTSNAIPIYIHPVVTGVVLGTATPGVSNGSCPANTPDPGTDCCPNDTIGTPVPTPAGTVDGSKCISQNQVGQLIARVYANGKTDAADNITCQVGHLTFAAQTPSIVSIDENGAATAQMPGSTAITATISNSSTATDVGFFSTCPPASIQLSAPGKTNPVNVAINTTQPLTTTVFDTNNNIITGLNLEFNSTTPQTIPAVVGSVTPLYPGSADITAVCQPSTCNTAPFSQIGLYGNGVALTSNPITINAVGTSSTVLYMGSTSSQYVALRDFTTNQPSALIKLPYVPNSMVMNQAGTVIYFGSPEGMMSINTANNTVTGALQTVTGTVLSVSPDGTTIIITDPIRQTISLIPAIGGTVTTSYGGVATSASWSPDSQTVYITTTTPTVLTHSLFTDWQSATTATTTGESYSDVAVTVPSVGAYFAGPQTTDGRSYCPASTITGTATPPNVNNQFIPLVDEDPAITDQLAATTDGQHILGAHAVSGGTSTLSDIDLTQLPTNTACPAPPAPQPGPGYFSSTHTTQNLAGINAAAITGVVPSSNSAAAFVTYAPPSANPTTNALLPLYVPPATGQGTLQYITLGNGATTEAAPLAGVFSTDNFTFYIGTGSSDPTDTTSADNDVHLITMTYPTSGAPTATETGILSPQLPLATGSGYAPVNLIAQHPKKSTS
jgi:hypothetical protein